MSSIIFGGILILFALYQIASKNGPRFYIDQVLWAVSWGALFLFNGAFGWPYNQSVLTNALVFFYVLIFLLGHQFAIGVRGERAIRMSEPKDLPAKKNLVLPGIFLFTVICAGIGMGAPYELLTHGGSGGIKGLTEGDYGATVNNINGEMKRGLVEQSMLGKVSFAAPQAALILVGLFMTLGNYGKLKSTILVSLALSPLIAFTVISTLRSPLFLGVLLLVASVIAAKVIQGVEHTLFKTKYVFYAFAIVCALGVVLVFFQSIRMGNLGLAQTGKTLEKLRLWVAGYIPGFHGWLWSSWDGNLTWGSSLFRFLTQLTNRESGLLTAIGSDIYIGDYTYTNACTMLQPAIHDFGLIGCGVFFFAWGVLSRFVLAQARSGSIFWAVMFACDLAAIVWSPNSFFFLYGSRVLAPAMALLYFGARRFRFRSKGRVRFGESGRADHPGPTARPAQNWR